MTPTHHVLEGSFGNSGAASLRGWGEGSVVALGRGGGQALRAGSWGPALSYPQWGGDAGASGE